MPLIHFQIMPTKRDYLTLCNVNHAFPIIKLLITIQHFSYVVTYIDDLHYVNPFFHIKNDKRIRFLPRVAASHHIHAIQAGSLDLGYQPVPMFHRKACLFAALLYLQPLLITAW
ncbi:hypothetical protein PBPRB0760 [Photobacterium profundum SS9]|uniref:Uncharacterized protein n=1 Tax=Photobacterium profundum (strain SS9) TaxID=298386 RepID=Q6LJ98_PHOPR|nr:hypothetical protein PBPRB0760 [Photobacterium profundum SS9]